MAALRAQMQTSSVNVEVDAAPQEDLARVMEEIRMQYEGINEKNRREMEQWYKGKVRTKHHPGPPHSYTYTKHIHSTCYTCIHTHMHTVTHI